MEVKVSPSHSLGFDEITPGTRTAKRTCRGKRKDPPELLSQSHTATSPQKVDTVAAAKEARNTKR